MAPITWRNVDPSSTGAAFLGMREAGKTFNNVTDTATAFLKEGQNKLITGQNMQTDRNTEADIASMQGFSSLSDLLAARDQFTNTDAIRQRYGDLADAAKIQQGYNDRVKFMEDQIYGSAMEQAKAAAEQSGSVGAGLTTLRDALRAGGMDERSVTNYVAAAKDKDFGLMSTLNGEATKTNMDSFLGSINPAGLSIAAVPGLIKQGQERYGKNFDSDRAYEYLVRFINGNNQEKLLASQLSRAGKENNQWQIDVDRASGRTTYNDTDHPGVSYSLLSDDALKKEAETEWRADHWETLYPASVERQKIDELYKEKKKTQDARIKEMRRKGVFGIDASPVILPSQENPTDISALEKQLQEVTAQLAAMQNGGGSVPATGNAPSTGAVDPYTAALQGKGRKLESHIWRDAMAAAEKRRKQQEASRKNLPISPRNN